MLEDLLRCALCKIRHSPATPVAFDKEMGLVCCTPVAGCNRRQRLAHGE